MRYLLSLDQGTTSSRSILFTPDGKAHASAQQEFEQIYPSPGHVEHDPEEIFRTQLATARKALRKAKAGPRDVAASPDTITHFLVAGQPVHCSQ